MIETTLAKPNLTLFENQRSHVDFLIKKRRALVFDKTGSGKTVCCLYAYAILKQYKRLDTMFVMTPLSAYSKKVWESDLKKFFNLKCIDLDTLVKRCTTSNEDLSRMLKIYDVIYAKHSHVHQVGDFIDRIMTSGRVLTVIDEAHKLKNPKSSLTVNVRNYTRNTYALWCLTATPLSKDLTDSYNIINFTIPWYFGSFVEFKKRYCRVMHKVIGRMPGGGLKKAELITGFSDKEGFMERLSQIAVVGESYLRPNFHYIDYQLSADEYKLYKKIANGINMDPDMDQEEWIKHVMESEELPETPIKDISRYSSRFIYLQSAADGILDADGNQNKTFSTKLSLLMERLQEIVAEGESVLVYFDYYAAERVAKYLIEQKHWNVAILESTGKNQLTESDVTLAKVKQKPHIILCTRASSESASYYFINNVIFFQIPTVPSTFSQFVGRIVRKNTLFPDDLHVWIFRSNNIDLYKLYVISSKTAQMEAVSGEESNIPDDYKELMTQQGILEKQKKILLWRTQ